MGYFRTHRKYKAAVGLWGFFGVAVLFALPASAAKVETITRMDYSGGTAGHAWVRSNHVMFLRDYNGLEAFSSELYMRTRLMTVGSVTLDEEHVAEGVVLDSSLGSLYNAHLHQGACLLIEGAYTSRTDGGTRVAGAVPIYSNTTTGGWVYLNCPPDEPCYPGGLQASTVAMALDGSGTMAVELPNLLSRVEQQGREGSMPEEWALVEGDRVLASSEKKFAEGLRGRLKSLGLTSVETESPSTPRLVVQSPVHAQNGRHVHLPGIRLLDSALPPTRRTVAGATVLARLEISIEDLVEEVDLLYASDPTVADDWLRDFLDSRIAPAPHGEKRHRTHAYVLLTLGDQMTLVDSIVALPQCCCGPDFCA